MKTVLVLMSTYNGEKFLEEQIESVLKQQNIEVNLLIRDDGSTDKTIEIIEKYKNTGKVILDKGTRNLGSANSFFSLLENAPVVYDYYAFCDQDDVWMDNKLFSAIQLLEKSDKSNKLYCASQFIVDEQLSIISKLNIYKYSKKELLLRNSVQGCTMVFSLELLKEIKKYRPVYLEMHDSWLIRICTYIEGDVIYDEQSYSYYRQHSLNVVGVNETFFDKIKKKLNKIRKSARISSKTAYELLQGYSELMTDEDSYYLFMLSNYKSSVKVKIKLLVSTIGQIKKINRKVSFLFELLFNKL